MKVYVYENYESMRCESYDCIEIKNVRGIEQSKVGGWAIVTDKFSYCFPKDSYIRIDKGV